MNVRGNLGKLFLLVLASGMGGVLAGLIMRWGVPTHRLDMIEAAVAGVIFGIPAGSVVWRNFHGTFAIVVFVAYLAGAAVPLLCVLSMAMLFAGSPY